MAHNLLTVRVKDVIVKGSKGGETTIIQTINHLKKVQPKDVIQADFIRSNGTGIINIKLQDDVFIVYSGAITDDLWKIYQALTS